MATKKATKKAVKKTAAKAAKKVKKAVASVKKASKKVKASSGRKPNAAFMKVLVPSAALAAVVGSAALARTEVVKKMWAYIKKNQLQNPKNMRNILADSKLKDIFGKGEVSMFEMTKLLGKHLK